MSVPAAWPQVLTFFGTPLVIEPSAGTSAGGAPLGAVVGQGAGFPQPVVGPAGSVSGGGRGARSRGGASGPAQAGDGFEVDLDHSGVPIEPDGPDSPGPKRRRGLAPGRRPRRRFGPGRPPRARESG